jgi:hypothetical protein
MSVWNKIESCFNKHSWVYNEASEVKTEDSPSDVFDLTMDAPNIFGIIIFGLCSNCFVLENLVTSLVHYVILGIIALVYLE